MSKGFDVESVEFELPKEDMKKLMKKYKQLKKYQKSNLHTLQKLDGKKTVIDELIEESEDYEM
jgi:hypothetical protein|tara:strand:- start:120 stop:308 length:189 start_codon:yes stop_codon:yes gene_type:complete